MLVFADQQGFYVAAAGIIPVLFLVLMIGDGRVVRAEAGSSDEWRNIALIAIGVMALMVLGEMSALRVLQLGHDSYLLRGATVSAIIYGFGIVFAQAVKLVLLEGKKGIPRRRIEALGRLYMFVVVILLALSYAILMPDLFLI
jgi:hypothetical protein